MTFHYCLNMTIVAEADSFGRNAISDSAFLQALQTAFNCVFSATQHNTPVYSMCTSGMTPLDFSRLQRGLSRLILEANNTLSESEYSQKRLEIFRIIDVARICIDAGCADPYFALSPGQIKHWVRNAVGDILEEVNPPPSPPATPAPRKRTTNKSVTLDAGIKKRFSKRIRRAVAPSPPFRPHLGRTAADLECAKALLELTAKPVVFAEV